MSSSGESEERLLDRLRQGDETALGELFSIHRPRLARMVAFRLDPKLAGRVDADDVLQEAYLDAAKRIRHFLDHTSLSFFVWLRQIVLQTMIDVRRQHLGAQMRDVKREVSLHKPRRPDATSMSMAAQLLGHLTSPSQAAMRAEMAARLEQALESMEPIDREVLALRHFEELSNSEVAEVLEIKQKAASIRYVRAVARLKGILEQIPGFSDST
jgi:RNA polymerase sigma-70 factor (ECF subfamily)